MNIQNMMDTEKIFIDECHKHNCKVVKFSCPEPVNVQEYLMKKYAAKETIDVSMYLNVIRNDRSDNEIEQCIRALKVKFIMLLLSAGLDHAANLLNIKFKFKVID